MKQTSILPLLLVSLLASCGDNSPFDEDYWEDPQVRSNQQSRAEDQTGSFTVDLAPLNANVGNFTGSVDIRVNETDAITTTQLTEVPQSLMIAERSITTQTCEDIAATNPPPVIVNNTGEFKNINETSEASREALIADLNQTDPQNGDSVNLNGKRYVVKAFINNTNSPVPQNVSVIPVACGVIFEGTSQDQEGGSTGGTTTGTVGGTAGGTIGGTVGGTIGGTTGTTTVGTIGTIDGGGTVGTIDGGVAGGIDGTIGGTVAGGTGGADGTIGGIDGTIGGGATGGVNGTFGGATGGL